MTDLLHMTLLTICLGAAETLAITSITKYSKTTNPYYMIFGMLLYGLAIPYGIAKTLNYSNIATINLLWNVLTTISIISVSYLYFGDKLTSLHLVSLFLGIASISILYLAEKIQ